MIDSVFAFFAHIGEMPHFWGFISIPIVAAVVTWAHVWVAMKMVFFPLEFVGIWKPWIGWQGIVPRKAGKMAGIVVDNTLAKLGSLSEIFREMEPDRIARHVSTVLVDRMEELIDEIMHEKNRVFWENLPISFKKRVYARVRRQVPAIMDGLVRDLGENIEDLIDLRGMVVRQMEADKALVVRVFQDVGDREIAFIVTSSFWIGFALGLVQMVLWYFYPSDWGLPIYGAVLGYATNWIALAMVFRPLNPIKIGPWRLQGLFLQRQPEIAEKFAELSAQEMVSLKHLVHEMLTGTYADRTRALIRRHISPLLEGGVVRTAIQLTVGPTGYAALKRTIVEKASVLSLQPLDNVAFNRDRAKVIASIFSTRMKAMSSKEFQDLLRPAFQEDEWIVIVMGGIMGFLAGWLQLVLGFTH
ncbi:MAG: hypothetical protein Q8J78_08825 [Moraxellaceae bacterium]|nr:hypothetical protein [Moraxellaceae bacterium]